jgi:hypothetical protein
MTRSTLRCAFLSTDNLDGYVVDDQRAYDALASRGVDVRAVSWRERGVNWGEFDLVVVRSTWDYHEHVEAFFKVLESIDQSSALLANPLWAMRWNARKTYLNELREHGVPIVPTVFGDRMDRVALSALAAHFGQAQWIVKPDVGANASGVVRVHGKPDAQQSRRLLDNFGARGYLAQPFVDDVTQHGEYSLFYFAGDYSHGIVKTPAAGDFRVQEEHGGRIVALTPPAPLRAAADKVCGALPPDCLYARIDLVANERDAFEVMEVELIEPSLYLRMDAAAPDRFARALCGWYRKHKNQAAKKRGQADV